MDSRQFGTLYTCRGAQRFMNTNDAALGDINRTGLRLDFDDVVELLAIYAEDQSAASLQAQGTTWSVEAAKKDLRERHLKPIVYVAQLIVTHEAQFRALKVPTARTSTKNLVAAAGGIFTLAETYAPLFIRMGLSPDFIAEGRAAAARIQTLMLNRNYNHDTKAGATSGVAELTRTAQLQLTALDVMVRKEIGGDARLLGEWESVRRLPGHQRKALSSGGTEARRLETPRAKALPSGDVPASKKAWATAKVITTPEPKKGMFATVVRKLLGAG